MARMPATDGGGVDLLVPTFVWPMDRLGSGSQIMPGAAQYGDVDAYGFTSSDSTTLVSSTYKPSNLLDARYGSVTFPQVTGTAPDRPPGVKLGMGVSTWALARRAEGRAIWVAEVWKCPYGQPFTWALFAMWQDAHTAVLDQYGSFRVRAKATGGEAGNQGCLQTWMVENNGSDTISLASKDHDAYFVDHERDDPLIGCDSGRVMEVFIQATPNDPALSGDTHKHNMSVWIRTRNTDGSVYFAPTLFTHYTAGASGANAWNTRIEEPFHMGRTIGENANDGYQGDLLGVAMGALANGTMLTESQVTAVMDRLWSDAAQLDGWPNRGRGRSR